MPLVEANEEGGGGWCASGRPPLTQCTYAIVAVIVTQEVVVRPDRFHLDQHCAGGGGHTGHVQKVLFSPEYNPLCEQDH